MLVKSMPTLAGAPQGGAAEGTDAKVPEAGRQSEGKRVLLLATQLWPAAARAARRLAKQVFAYSRCALQIIRCAIPRSSPSAFTMIGYFQKRLCSAPLMKSYQIY